MLIKLDRDFPLYALECIRSFYMFTVFHLRTFIFMTFLSIKCIGIKSGAKIIPMHAIDIFKFRC